MNVAKMIGGIAEFAFEGAVDLTTMTMLHSLCPVKGAINVEKAALIVGKMGVSHAVTSQVTHQIKHDLGKLTRSGKRHHRKPDDNKSKKEEN